ncbi:MAG: hypothetical protein TREMPRED_002414 [Tremellales sp. Tagirdzhanova-0007]|nr:MAG: hypothetical protein TREMPRED_002414 [Tremellales sp. Tagirdzhanova-0007]
MQATVTDEAEELKAELDGDAIKADGDVEMKPVIDVDGNGSMLGEKGVDEAESGSFKPVESKPETVDPNKLPDDACETLYVQNLNEKVRTPVLIETLGSLFKPYRPLLPITAHHNVRMRGQAFVTFPDVEAANRARKDVNEFPLYGKGMVRLSSLPRVKVEGIFSDVDVIFAGLANKLCEDEVGFDERTRRNNPVRRKAAAKLKADESTAPAAKRQRLQMPDEYLPPNSVLFVQNLPEGTTSDDLREVFELHAGLLEIRTIPAKKDIAFVEFSDEGSATVAKDALHNFKIDGETKMKVTYARK